MSKKIKRALSVIIFLSILIGLFHAANVMLFEKQHFGTAKNVAYEDPQKIDVFFIGASHIFFGVNPMEIWNESGIAGYNLTTHQQPLWSSKLLLQHALKKQSPKLIVLDVLMATNFSRPLLGTDQGTNMTHLALDPVPLSLQKVRGVLATDAIIEKGEILFPIILNHSRLQQGLLTWDDLHFFSGDRSHPMKGYNYTENTIAYERPESVPDTTHELPEGLGEILIDFIQFCKKEGLPLLLIKTPLVGNQELYEQINTIGQIAAEQDVPFLDFNHLFDALNIDFHTDFADSGHLNVRGAEKVSRYLAGYLEENYDLPDHRGEAAYDSWERSAEHYANIIGLKNSDDILPHLEAACTDKNLVTVILSGGAMETAQELPAAVTDAFRKAGLKAAPETIGQGAYYAVIKGGKVILEKYAASGILTDEFMVKDMRFPLRVSSREPDGGSFMTALYIGKGGFSSVEPGMLVVSYDMDRMETVDAVRYAYDGSFTAGHLN